MGKPLVYLVLLVTFAAAVWAQSELTPHERFWCYNYYQSGCDSEPRIAPEEKADSSRLEFGPYNRVATTGYFVSYVGLELNDGCAPQETGLVFTYDDLMAFMNVSGRGNGIISPALVTPFFANNDKGRSFSNVWGAGIYDMSRTSSDPTPEPEPETPVTPTEPTDSTNTTIPAKRSLAQDVTSGISHNILFPFYFTSLFGVYDVGTFNEADCSADYAPRGFERFDRCMYRSANISGDTSAVYRTMDDSLMFIAPATSIEFLEGMKSAGDSANTVIYHDYELEQPVNYPDSLDRDLVHKFPRGWEIFYIPDCQQYMVKLINWQTVDLE